MKLRIYLASSWGNAEGVLIIADFLRHNGFEVDCFCDQASGRVGFNMAECLQALGHSLDEIDPITALKHPAVAEKFVIAFTEDKKQLDWCNCVIMLMPCGNSSHLEAGYAKGQGKLFYIYWLKDLVKGEFDSMYQFADGMYRMEELWEMIAGLKRQELPEMTQEEKEAQQYLDSGMVVVRDVKTVRHFLKRGSHTSKRTYNKLTEIIARVGCLTVAFRDLSQVKELLSER